MISYPRRLLSSLAIVATTAVGLCASCGGGSSGFRPREAEWAAIYESANSGMCLAADVSLEICAEVAQPGVGAICDANVRGCRFELVVHLTGLTPGTVVIGAVEPEDLSLRWRTSVNVVGPAGADGALAGSLDFVTDVPPGTTGVRALLFYTPDHIPPEPETNGLDVDLLSQLGAQHAEILIEWPMLHGM